METNKSLKEEAQEHKTPQTLNITDLDEVSLKLDVFDREGMDREGKSFYYKCLVIDGNEYRVPNPVLEQIKTIIKLKPDANLVKVTKTGSGVATKYTTDVVEK